MKIINPAQAGTFESSDILILVQQNIGKTGRFLEIDSTVFSEYGESIRETINSVLDEFGVDEIHLTAKDKGALIPTIKARTETAIKRSEKGITF